MRETTRFSENGLLITVLTALFILQTQDSVFSLRRLDRETTVFHHPCLEPLVVISGHANVVSGLPGRGIPPATLANDQLAVFQARNEALRITLYI
jgi:hypothetical protein